MKVWSTNCLYISIQNFSNETDGISRYISLWNLSNIKTPKSMCNLFLKYRRALYRTTPFSFSFEKLNILSIMS